MGRRSKRGMIRKAEVDGMNKNKNLIIAHLIFVKQSRREKVSRINHNSKIYTKRIKRRKEREKRKAKGKPKIRKQEEKIKLMKKQKLMTKYNLEKSQMILKQICMLQIKDLTEKKIKKMKEKTRKKIKKMIKRRKERFVWRR